MRKLSGKMADTITGVSTTFTTLCQDLQIITQLGTQSSNEKRDVGAMEILIESHRAEMREFGDMINKMYTTLPKSVLSSIQGSINPRKGKVGELVTLLGLASEYDRLIPLGKPVDFVGISRNSVDFIEVKVDGSYLTKEEKHIKDLITKGAVKYRVIRKSVDLDNLTECLETIEGISTDGCTDGCTDNCTEDGNDSISSNMEGIG
jgi:predicted Holliday junction resolvase-like endonuclease